MHGKFLNSCLNHLTIPINEKLWVLLTTYSEPKPIQTQNPEDLWLDWECLITYNKYVAFILQISLNIVTLCLFEMYINKSDDSMYGIALAIFSKLTKHKIANFM